MGVVPHTVKAREGTRRTARRDSLSWLASWQARLRASWQSLRHWGLPAGPLSGPLSPPPFMQEPPVRHPSHFRAEFRVRVPPCALGLPTRRPRGGAWRLCAFGSANWDAHAAFAQGFPYSPSDGGSATSPGGACNGGGGSSGSSRGPGGGRSGGSSGSSWRPWRRTQRRVFRQF